MSYSSFENDKLEPADKLRIDRKIYFEQSKADISGLTALPLEKLRAMREESAAEEQAVFERLQQQSKEWEEQAGKTLLIDKAIEYARTPEAQHTSNQWEQPDEYRHVMSNMVYRMQYSISENTRYDRETQKSIPYSWTLSWSIYTNSPHNYGQAKIAGQERKVFADRAAMEKYLNGRIKAYAHLFTEISPQIPQEYAEKFRVNGQLLPGYSVEGEEPTQPIQETEKADAAPAGQATEQTTGQGQEHAPMNGQFSILIDSRTRFETGEPGGEWLSMPTTTEQLHAAMKSVGISAENPQDFFINGFANTEQCPFDVPLPVVQGSTVDELNYLGKLLEMQGDEDRDKFTAAVTLGEHAGSVKDLINLAQNLDCYWIYPTVRTEADYGYYLIDELDELELPEEAKKYFNYEEYGRNAVQKDKGQFTEQGYVYNNGNTFSQWYNGRENDIPKEYKLMSFPEPERPAPDKLEKEEAAPEQEAAPQEQEQEQEPQPEAPPQPRPVNPIILTADKPAEKIKEITDRLEQGITELFDSERYKEYLQVMSKFHNYSFNNTLLIAMQKPDASLIAGFNAWKNNFGRNVMRGEKGIRILAPSPYKIRQEVEKKDPQTGKTVIGRDGKPVTETKEIQIPAYKVVAVFDVSQTEGRELPSISANELTGDVEQYEDFYTALEKTSPVPMGFEKIEGSAHGYYHLEEKRIAIDEGMSQLQNLKTAIHEIAHAKLHDIDLNAPEQPDRPDRRTREVQAESIAYTVCQHYGLDTSDYSFGYVAGWSSGRELAELKTSLETIRATAAEIINSIDGHFAELQKAREAQKAQEAEKEPTPDLTAEPTVTILYSESPQLREGDTFPLSRANALIEAIDEANLASPGYDKTEFRIDYVMNGIPDHYEGRQDLGDGEGALIEHIEKYHTYYANDPNWENFLLQHEGKEALEADKEHRAMLLNEFIPYLKLHCNLSEMERIAGEALQSGDNLTPTETAYHTAMQAYVAECRGLVNQGEYNLPPVPQLKDFDAELADYKEHVKEEIAQEAAAAGMTVEEYAANGYEPYAAPEQQQETEPGSTDAPPEKHFEPETFYKVRQNPYSDSPENSSILQEYMTQESGMAKLGDILYTGTPEKCGELLGKLEAGELTPGDIKELSTKKPEAAQKAQTTAEPGQDTPAARLTELQQKAVEIAKGYEKLPMRDKIGIIAQSFGGTSGKIETSPCTGKWRGTSDISIKFDNGTSLFIGNHRTPQAKTVKVQNEYINSALVRYNPEIISATKEAAITALRARETKDNELAAQKGLKPYTLLNVEFNDGTDEKSSGHMGWYYVTLAVDGKICSHIETGLNYAISDGKISEMPTRENYFAAGALKESDVDYVFNNVGFSSTSDLYSLPISGEVRERAEKTLAERMEAQPAAEPDKDNFTIYQLKDGDGMRDYHFEPYDRLQAAGLSVEAANYDLIYTAELTPGTSLEDIYTRFNIDHPKDFRGHSLSVSDIVVLHQNGEDTAHYVDSFGYKEVPEFLQEQTPQLTPDSRMTGEQIRTPRGSFSVTDMTAEQMREAGYGLHHTSEDGKYLIMGNGTQAFAVAAEQPEKANPLKHVEDTIEQNDNSFDGIINNTPTVDELEAKVKAGEQISLIDLANAVKADKERGKEAKPGKKPEKKPSIRAQLKADKERAAQKKQARSKSQDLERS